MSRERKYSKERMEALAAFRKRARRTGDIEGEALAWRLILLELSKVRR